MKLSFLLLIIPLIPASASSYAQGITLSKQEATLPEIFRELRKQTDYTFVYSNTQISNAKKVSISVKDAQITEVLDRCFENQVLTYTINNKTITIKEKAPSLLNRILKHFSTAIISGTVSDEQGIALSGATVRIQDSKTTTRTNEKGFFSINSDKDSGKLIISFLGYVTETVSFSSNNTGPFRVTLKQESSGLQEVEINAGYYTVKDRERTGSISRVTAETIGRQPVSNPLQALQNRVPGVAIEQQSGNSGGGFKVQIRSRTSINKSVANDPLYIVDGVPYPSADVSSGTSSNSATLGNAGTSPLSFLNPYDIESIEILKDADATAIYGSRGSSGVILITTKQGKDGSTKINAAITQGINQVGHRLDLLNTAEYLEMRNEAFRNDGLTPSSTDYDVNGAWDQNKYTDWQNELIGGTANVTNVLLNINGGSGKSNYLLGANYYKEGTVTPGDFGSARTGVHSSLNFGSGNDRFNASFTASYSHTQSKLISSDITRSIYLPPNQPDPFDAYGKLNWSDNTVYANPMAQLLNTKNYQTDNLVGSLSLNYHILKNLIFKTLLGYTNIKREELGKRPLAANPPAFNLTAASRASDFSNNYNNSLIAEPQISYSSNLGPGNLSGLIGLSFQEKQSQLQTITASGFNSDDLMENIGSASQLTNTQSVYSQYRYAAMFGRLNYNLYNKYFLNLTARRDGSTRFGEGKQFANFGAVGAAWIFSDEKFFKDNLSFLSFGKLRASYGITGNDQIGDYGYLQLWKSLGVYQGNSTISSARIANPDYSWETNQKAEAALQLGFLNDKLTLEISYYRNRSSNQLVGFPLPLSTGNGTIQANLPATVQNTGWEIMTNLNVLNREHLQWSFGFNLTIPKNKLVSYPGGIANSPYSLSYIIGQPLSISRIYNVRGVSSQTGVYDIEDKNNNGTLDNADITQHKFIGQRYYGGLQNSIRFKQFTLDFLISFNKQTGFNYMSGTLDPGFFDYSGPTSNQPSVVLSRWKQAGDQTSIPKFSTGFDAYIQYLQATTTGGENITDASFIRLKTASIIYNLPKGCLSRIKISDAKISVQGQNIFTLTRYVGLDPESQNMNLLPPLRALTIGLNLTF